MIGPIIGLLLLSIVPIVWIYQIWTHRHVTWLRYHIAPFTLFEQARNLGPISHRYESLSPEELKKFSWRAFYFLHTTLIEFKEYDGHGPFEKDRIKELLASLAAQMTLYLPEECFKMIHTIRIYPKEYKSPHSGKYHKGETNPGAGVIILSWTGIQEGQASHADGLNLIIHEYAHALWIEHLTAKYEIFSEEAAQEFVSVALAELKQAEALESHFLRDYGLTNFHEFHSVAVENFFERPDEMERNLPHVYQALVRLYNHNPLRW